MRHGVCEPNGCGSACCRDLWLEVAPVYGEDADVKRWLTLHNIGVVEQMPGRWFAHIDIQCSQLTEDGRCNCYGTPLRPQMCGDFPADRMSLEMSGLTEACSYTFSQDVIPLEVANARRAVS